MATGKDQAQAVVAEHGIFRLTFTLDSRSQGQLLSRAAESLQLILFFFEPHPPPYQIDGFVARRGDQPCPRVSGDALPRPLLERHRKSFLSHLLGQIEVSEEANQGRKNSGGFLAIHLLYKDLLDEDSFSGHRIPSLERVAGDTSVRLGHGVLSDGPNFDRTPASRRNPRR